MKLALSIGVVLATTTIVAAQRPVVITFEFYPGPDGMLGTPDDVPIVAPTLFASQPEQLTDQFRTVGIRFVPNPPINDMNEVLDAATFSTPPAHTAPNILASAGSAAIEAEFLIPVVRVEALIGISGGSDILEAYDANGILLDSQLGDDEVVTIETTRPIARIRVIPNASTTPAIDNLTFEGEAACYPDCTGEGTLDIFDFLCFQDAFVQGDPYADCTGEGTFDIFDFLCFQDAFVTGCP